jgi:hypothetical protein
MMRRKSRQNFSTTSYDGETDRVYHHLPWISANCKLVRMECQLLGLEIRNSLFGAADSELIADRPFYLPKPHDHPLDFFALFTHVAPSMRAGSCWFWWKPQLSGGAPSRTVWARCGCYPLRAFGSTELAVRVRWADRLGRHRQDDAHGPGRAVQMPATVNGGRASRGATSFSRSRTCLPARILKCR